MNKDALADSTRQRILNESRKLGISHELLTRRYVFERFLLLPRLGAVPVSSPGRS